MLRLGGSGPGSWSMPFYGIGRDVRYADGRRVQSVSLNQAAPLSPGLQLSHLVEFNRTSAPLFGSSARLTGAFDLATLSRSATQLRAAVGYGLVPRPQLTVVTLSADRRIGERTSLRALVGRNVASRQTLLGLSGQRRFNRFSLALDGSVTLPGQYSAVLRLGFGLGRNPLDGHLFSARPGLASGGAAAVRAFRDSDGDGRYGPGDEPLAGVNFLAGSEMATTGKTGIALLGNLGDGQRAAIRIDPDTLPDIALAPVREGVLLAPRAGRIAALDFPVVVLSELAGTAQFRTPEGARPVSGLILLLEDPAGTPAARTRTAGDGSFWLEKLKAGSYRIALDPAQAERLRIKLVGQPAAMLDKAGTAARLTIMVEPQ